MKFIRIKWFVLIGALLCVALPRLYAHHLAANTTQPQLTHLETPYPNGALHLLPVFVEEKTVHAEPFAGNRTKPAAVAKPTPVPGNAPNQKTKPVQAARRTVLQTHHAQPDNLQAPPPPAADWKPYGSTVWEERVKKGLFMVLGSYFTAWLFVGLVYLFSRVLAVEAVSVLLIYAGLAALPALFIYGWIIMIIGLLALRRLRKMRERGESIPEGERTF